MNRPIGDKSIITIFDQVLKDTINFTNVYSKGKNSKGKNIMGRHYTLRSWRGSLITYLAAMGMSTRHIQLFSLHSSHSVIDYYVEKLELLKLKQGLMDKIQQNLCEDDDTCSTVASNSATYTCTQQPQSNVEQGASIDAEYGDAYGDNYTVNNDYHEDRFNNEHGDEFGDNYTVNNGDEYHDNYQDTLNYGVNDEHHEVPERINFEQGVCNDYIDDGTADIYMDQNECDVYSRNSMCVNGTVDDETMISLGPRSKGIDMYIFQIANSFTLLHIQD